MLEVEIDVEVLLIQVQVLDVLIEEVAPRLALRISVGLLALALRQVFEPSEDVLLAAHELSAQQALGHPRDAELDAEPLEAISVDDAGGAFGGQRP